MKQPGKSFHDQTAKQRFFDKKSYYLTKTLENIEDLLRKDKTTKQQKNWKLVKTVKNWYL